MDELSIARGRLGNQRLAWQTYPSPEQVVGGLLGVQAENYSQASWAIATRTDGVTEERFGELFDAGRILRTHVLRPTWHFVLPEDIGWLLELTGPRIRGPLTQMQQSLAIDRSDLDRSLEVLAESLAGETHLSRDELALRLREDGLPGNGQRLTSVLMHAELSAVICSGSREDGQQTYALLEERAGPARRLEPDEALAELVLRYFKGHGPATERDLAYWATLTLTQVREGLAAVAGDLHSFSHDGRTYWHGPLAADADPVSPRGHLLQVLDEYYRGYQESRYLLDMAGVVPRGREANTGMALVDGQMVGGMSRSLKSDRVRFEVTPYRPLSPDEVAALAEAGDRYGRFLGRDAEVTTL